MSDISAKSFLALLNKSQLCENAKLKASLSELSRMAGGKPIKLDQLTTHLLEDGLISEWHIKKLVTGKYKGFFLGKYKLLRLLGTGGMSTVYLAQHTIFDQQRAIKVLPRDRVADKTYLQRFFREGRAAAALNDKNIVRVYDIGNEGDTHYLVMEYVKGEDIYEMVKKRGPLPFDRSIDYMIQALTGLQHAHDTELVHRDVKPANLLVTEDGVVKILDLGLALFQEDDSSLTVMHNERVLGTADYLSPEQAVDSHNLDHRSDIYSAGCTLYFMLTGKPPFFEGTLAQRIAKHQQVEPQDIRDFRPDCPEELSQLVTRMMKKKPEDRFHSCDDAVMAFRAVSENLLLSTTTSTAKAPAAVVPAVVKKPVVKPKPATKEEAAAKEKPVAKAKQPAKKVPPKSSAKPVEKKMPKPVVDVTEKAIAKPAADAKKKTTDSKPKTVQPVAAAKSDKKVHPKSASKPKPAAKKIAPAAKQTAKPAAAPRKQVIDIGRKSIDPNSVSVVIGETKQAAEKSVVGDSELSQFVTTAQKSARKSVRPKRTPVKNQMLMTGMVIGMLLLLGLVVTLAMWFGG